MATRIASVRPINVAGASGSAASEVVQESTNKMTTAADERSAVQKCGFTNGANCENSLKLHGHLPRGLSHTSRLERQGQDAKRKTHWLVCFSVRSSLVTTGLVDHQLSLVFDFSLHKMPSGWVFSR